MGRHIQPDAVAVVGAVSRAALACRVQVEMPLASLSAASVRRWRTLYRIDEGLGPIELTIDHCGLFASRGQVSRFACAIELDPANPLDTRIELTVDAGAIVLFGWDAPSWLPLVPWFDLAVHPVVRFRSSAVTSGGVGRWVLRGLLEFGGVTRLQALDAVLVGHRADPITDTDVVDLLITGGLRCSAFGMPADQAFISDRVELVIRARIELER
jgi:polyisoprenoid-binding protein YceI